ncbi:unnamed protein product [Cylindrotheca closterium]|uniref:Reverse transcriptase Ty1/copia-type domain-containing protein n=1 Tax=Cylindrotheca closterium TaxID=2856 RepID=A0AAD2CIK3_9STRA|nr:unnamed protein product [Cylindrotheca closterium]CAJ1951059.1 unnamed protein product [Cylindrotheca closterium]
MTIGWKHGENTPEPLNITGANESVTYAIYSRNHNLPENQGCKLLQNIVKDKRKFLCPTNQVKLRLLHATTPKYLYNYNIQEDHNGVLRLDKLHGNTNWKHATKVEMDLLATYKVLVDMGRGTPLPKDHQTFRVQLVNALKHFDKHKPRLLPFGDLTYVLPNKTKPSCLLTDQSVVVIIHHMLNGTPIGFFSKEQSNVETATYGSEFVATQTYVKQIMDLQQTLRYLGVPIKGQSYMFGDNECVVNSSSRPEAKLHKGHVALSFHRVREAVACNMLSFIHIDGVLNPADILSKHRGHQQIWPLLRTLMFWSGDTADQEE